MFRSATTRIAHNSTVPGLARIGNKDLKALQDLITSEKAVMQTLQKLAVDLARSSEALKQWGAGEGDDLGDPLTACSTILIHFSTALSKFSNHEGAVREQMKSVRTREENLDELKQRRKSLVSKADAADRKLSKMSSENKNFQSQADALNKLREEIRRMDTEIMTEEASLGDYKRSTAKHWMGTKFGALMESCEKGMIVGELGKHVIAEIPLTATEPGLPRAYYTGHARTEFLVSEAQRSINEVVFSIEPNSQPSSSSIRPLPGNELPPLPGQIALSESYSSTPGHSAGTPSIAPTDLSGDAARNRYSQVYMSPSSAFTGLPEISTGTQESLPLHTMQYSAPAERPPSQPRSPPPMIGRMSDPFAANPMAPPSPVSTEISEFGTYNPSSPTFSPRITSLRNIPEHAPSPGAVGGPRAARFATFPVKIGAGGPRPQPQIPPVSFPTPQPLGDRAPSIEIDRAVDSSFSSSIAEALGKEWVSEDPSRRPPSMHVTPSKMNEVKPSEWSPPPPSYSSTAGMSTSPFSKPPQTPNHADHTAPPSGVSHARESEVVDEDNVELAYMATEQDEHVNHATPAPPHGDRRVSFVAAQDEGAAYGLPEIAEQPEPQADQGANTSSPTSQPAAEPVTHPTPPRTPTDKPLPSPVVAHTLPIHIPEVVPPPSPPAEDEEKALNAAAAREVSRELDALMFNSPIVTRQPEPPQGAPPSPLQPPVAPFVSRGRPSLGGETPASPTRSEHEMYIRERDRSSSMPKSPVTSDNGHPQQPLAATPDSLAPQLPPVPAISMRTPSPAYSALSASSAYKTPSEFPLPPGPGSFYNLPGSSGSGPLTPGGGRTISAAAFKRIRSPSSPPPQVGQGTPEVSPLVINKRPLPSSPRLSSAPEPGSADPRNRPLPPPSSLSHQANRDSMVRPPSMAHSSGGEGYGDDEYDYISAYVDEIPGLSPAGQGGEEQRHASQAGYGQGQFATNLDHDGIR